MRCASATLVVEARAEHVGRRVATYRVEVRSGVALEVPGEELVALFTGTVYRRPRADANDKPM